MTIPSTTSSTRTNAGVRLRAVAALTCLVTFPLAVALAQLAQPNDYAPLSHPMSELALGGAPGLMGLAFFAMGAGTILVSGVLRSTVERMRVTPNLLMVAGVLDFVAGGFRTNAPGTPSTLASGIHALAAVTMFLLMTAGMFASYPPMRHDPRWSGFAPWSLAWAALSVPAFILMHILGKNLYGLSQRIFVGLFLTWLITVAGIGRHKSNARSPHKTEHRASDLSA